MHYKNRPSTLPDLDPSDFWYFPKLKKDLKGQRFADNPDIQCKVMVLQDILQNNFQDGSGTITSQSA
jgi:hypothetical protein